MQEYPITLMPHCASLLGKVVAKASDIVIWAAVAQLVMSFENPQGSMGGDEESSSIVGQPDQVIGLLHNDWKSAYFDQGLTVLQETIRGYEKEKIDGYYARSLVFVQSSGMGKSRLADEFGRKCPMVNFVLRESGRKAYPPPDDEIRDFMLQPPPDADSALMWYHTLAVALLLACFKMCKLDAFRIALC